MEKAEFYRRARAGSAGPLAGIRVLELTTTWAGPMCACLLADFGAEVTKVESPDGDVARRLPPFLPGTDPPVSFMHATVNRNKRNLTLDLHHSEAQAIFRRLAVDADIVVENFRPGTVDGWEIGYEAIRNVNDDVIFVSISGYGQWGPDFDQIGYDPLAQARSGFLSLNGSPEGTPVKAPIFLADDLGGMQGALAALAALEHRRRTGEGQHIDVALLDSLLAQSNGFLTLGALAIDYPRMGNEFPFAAPSSVFPCRDGHVYCGALLDSQWQKLARVMGHDALAEDPRYQLPERLARRAEVNQLVTAWTSQHTVDEVVTALRQAAIAGSPVRTYKEAARDPHVQARDMLQEVEIEGGSRQPITGPAAKLSRTPTAVRTGAAALGQHNAEILAELGYDEAGIEALRAAGVI